jgi:hypothetical protein
MKKRELFRTLERRGPNGMMDARRISHRIELRNLNGDAEITESTIKQWIDERPETAKIGIHLTDIDFKLIGRIIDPKRA